MKNLGVWMACAIVWTSSPASADCSVPDLDGDGFPNTTDNCPTIPNPGQAPGAPPPRGAACDDGVDLDGDTIADVADNCPLVSNPGQEDSDAGSSTELVLGNRAARPERECRGSERPARHHRSELRR